MVNTQSDILMLNTQWKMQRTSLIIICIAMLAAFPFAFSSSIISSSSTFSTYSTLSLQPTFPYDPITAQQLYTFASAAYCDSTNGLLNWTCLPCQQLIASDSDSTAQPNNVSAAQIVRLLNNDTTDNFGFIAIANLSIFHSAPLPDADDKVIILAYRGTHLADLQNWMEDLQYDMIHPFVSPSVKVHQGFWESYVALKEQMLDGIQNAIALTESSTIIAVGHSMGASMASLAVVDLALHYYPQFHYALYTEGSPRTGDADFSALLAQFASASFRVVHYADPIAQLPPESWDFRHVPFEVFYNDEFTHYRVCNNTITGEQADCSDGLLLALLPEDHSYYFQTEVGPCDHEELLQLIDRSL